MTQRCKALFLPTLLAVAGLVFMACGDDDKDDGHGGHEDELTADCAAISDACHDADEGTGKAHECHELAHENEADACSAEKAACVAACAAHSH